MAEHQVRPLPVLNRSQQLVGIIAIADIACSGDKEAEEEAIEGVSEPSDSRVGETPQTVSGSLVGTRRPWAHPRENAWGELMVIKAVP
jgi:CBS domain-containing protein